MKERRKVWGLYDYDAKNWDTWIKGGKRATFETLEEARKYVTSTHTPRPFYLVKKSNPRTELTKRVIDAAREYRRIEGQYGGTDEQFEGWKTLNCALKEYDGEQITREDM